MQTSAGTRRWHTFPMTESVPEAGAPTLSSRLLGVLVAWPAVLMIWGPVWPLAAAAVTWGLVYALAPRRADRWPWWVLGQWVTLIAMFSLAIARMDNIFNFTVVGAAAIFALIAVAIWMAPVAIAELHRTQWRTRRPRADSGDGLSSGQETSVEPTTLR